MSENSPENLLDQVKDKESFLTFLQALIENREVAEKMERENPKYWQLGGANGWQNSSISAFLEAASCYFDNPNYEHRDVPSPPISWHDLAVFLYFGKIYE